MNAFRYRIFNLNDREISSGEGETSTAGSVFRRTMRILISALLLALSVTHHFLAQIRGTAEVHGAALNTTSDGNKDAEGTSSPPPVPVIVVTYKTRTNASAPDTSGTVKRLEKLASALSGEASDQGLAECRGFTPDVLKQLDSSSSLSSSAQLSLILKNVISGETKRPTTKTLVKGVLAELENRESDLNSDLERVEPLKYLIGSSLE